MKVHDFNNGERYVLFNDEMRLVRPVNDFLRTLSVKGLSENTIKAYATLADASERLNWLVLVI